MKCNINRFLGFSLVVVLVITGCQSSFVQPGNSAGTTGDFLDSGLTASFFRAIQIDPPAEDSAGPQFVAHGDFNNDGRVDLVSAWNESQPIQIHLQQPPDVFGSIFFATVPLGGTTPIAITSDLKVADMDQDGFDDVIVLVKDTGLVPQCDLSREDCDVTDNGGFLEDAVQGAIVIFFNPQDPAGRAWEAITLPQSILAGTAEGELPETGGYTAMDVGEIDNINGPDIVVALNSPEGDPAIEPETNRVDFYPNTGGATARNAEGWSRITLHQDRPQVSDCRITDVDGDGDNDIIVTYPNAKNANVRWIPNPLSFGAEGNVFELWPPHAPIGQVATNANVIELGDIDGDGNEDVMVRSSAGKIIQWFRKPTSPSQTFIRSPWQVFTIAEFSERSPGAIALGDLTGNGQLDAAIAAEGAVEWFTPFSSTDPNSAFALWQENLIVDDGPPPDQNATTQTDPVTTVDPATGQTIVTDPNANPQATGGTLVNTMLIVDIDGDGRNDIVGTLDRNALSGLSNDALVLFLNTGF
ncbi:MAG: VCBS repeat-containing protein [Planctomycetes bacterium]|nr:VCBS repeat-containing protein [Planctomycetota bacterium]